MIDSDRCPLARGSSVHQDWCAWLPEEKELVFHRHAQHLESLYNMFSVSLNEALELRLAGCHANALKALRMAANLCKRLSSPLAGILRALHEHSRHHGIVPSTAPLDASNYAGQKAQRSARLSGLLNHVLLSQRLQFLHKVSTIEEMVEDLDNDFRSAVGDLADVASMHPEQLWKELAADHYDLNTCLREALILLKSFLVVLPASELPTFQDTVQQQCQPLKDQRLLSPAGTISNRRIAAFAGK